MGANYDDAIAIIGSSGRFTGAKNLDELWGLVSDGKIGSYFLNKDELKKEEVSDELINNPNFVPIMTGLPDVACFDAKFFNINDNNATLSDPQNRLLLEESWHAIEDAGYDPKQFGRIYKVGVFAGKNGSQQYLLENIITSYSGKYWSLSQSHLLEILTTNNTDYLANWIAYKFGFTGPALNIQTACSTSLAVLASAYQNLLLYQCDVALVSVAGISLGVGYLYDKGGIFSPDGFCRPFDVNANGTFSGNGVSSLVLKRLDDALREHDKIEAIILGVGLSNDGSLKQDFMSPGIQGQIEAISMALRQSGLESNDIDYIETHGTATKLGDPVEITALNAVYNNAREKPCYLGSVKANIGHLFANAGIAGLQKTILALKNKSIPPLANFNSINPLIQFNDKQFAINKELLTWDTGLKPRRAGVSSFGFGGTNVHVILEESPTVSPIQSSGNYDENIIFLSAKSPEQVKSLVGNWKDSLAKVNLENAAYTSLVGRHHFEYRIAQVVDKNNLLQTDNLNILKKLSNLNCCWVFSGQGYDISCLIGNQLSEKYSVFNQAREECYNLVPNELRKRYFSYLKDNQIIVEPVWLQISIFIYQYALAKLWMSLGFRPSCIVGHSLGEYAAAVIANKLTLASAVELVLARGKAFSDHQVSGGMIVVFASAETIPQLQASLQLAALNAEDITIVSGLQQDLLNYECICKEQSIATTFLKVSHPFHNRYLLESIAKQFHHSIMDVETISKEQQIIPFYSTLTGELHKNPLQHNYWVEQLLSTTLFKQAINSSIMQSNSSIILEIGPVENISPLAKRFDLRSVVSSRSDKTERHDFLCAIKSLYEYGIEPQNGDSLFSNNRTLISMPTYPFEKNIFWYDHNLSSTRNNELLPSTSNKLESDKFNSSSIQLSDDYKEELTPQDAKNELINLLREYWVRYLGNHTINDDDDFFELGGNSLAAIQIQQAIEKDLDIVIEMTKLIELRTLAQLADYVAIKIMEN